jgi:amidase
VEPVVWSAWQTARRFSATDYLAAVNTFHRLGRQLAQFHERFDLLLTPTLAEPPALLGRFAMDNPDFIDYRLGRRACGATRRSARWPTPPARRRSRCRWGVRRAGLPIGAMLAAPHGHDALLLRVAAQWEAAHGPARCPSTTALRRPASCTAASLPVRLTAPASWRAGPGPAAPARRPT